jgi:hypothetical protein
MLPENCAAVHYKASENTEIVLRSENLPVVPGLRRIYPILIQRLMLSSKPTHLEYQKDPAPD